MSHIVIIDKVDPHFEQAIYWITGINLSTFSFSRSDDPDASGLVIVWQIIKICEDFLKIIMMTIDNGPTLDKDYRKIGGKSFLN